MSNISKVSNRNVTMDNSKSKALSRHLQSAVYKRINERFAPAGEQVFSEAENTVESGLLTELRHLKHALQQAENTAVAEQNPTNKSLEHADHLTNESRQLCVSLARILGKDSEIETADTDKIEVFQRVGHLTAESIARSSLNALRDPAHARIRKCQQITNYLKLYRMLHALLNQFLALRSGSILTAIDSVIKNFLPHLARVCLAVSACPPQIATECNNIRLFAAQLWQFCIKSILQDVFTDVLPTFQHLGYPSWQAAWQKPTGLPADVVAIRFSAFIHRLCAIEACCRKYDMRKRSALTSFSWPNAFRLLFIPFERCFCYHFYAGDIVVSGGNAKEQEDFDSAREFSRRMTADAERPEFFLHVARQWIENNAHFFQSFVQPIYDQSIQQSGDNSSKTLSRLNFAEEFAFYIVRMVTDKLLREWHREGSLYKRNKFLFAHVVEEIFLFARKLQQMGFSSASMNINSVVFLLEPEVFGAWSRILHEQCKFNVERVCSSLLLLDTPSASTVVVGIEGCLNEQVAVDELHPLAMASIELGRKLELIFQSVVQDRLNALPCLEAQCRIFKDFLDLLSVMHAELRKCAIAFDTIKGHQNVDALTPTVLPSNFVKYLMLFKVISIALTKFRSLLDCEPTIVKLLMDESDMTPAMVLAMSQMPPQLKQERTLLQRRTEANMQKCIELQSGIIDAAIDATHEAIDILMEIFLFGNLYTDENEPKTPTPAALNAFGKAKLATSSKSSTDADRKNELVPALGLIASTINNAVHAFILFVPAHLLVALCRDFILSIDRKLLSSFLNEMTEERPIDTTWLGGQLQQLVDAVDNGTGFSWLSTNATSSLSRMQECTLLLRLEKPQAVLLAEGLAGEKSNLMQKMSSKNNAETNLNQKVIVDGKHVMLNALTHAEVVQTLRKRHDLHY